MGIALYFDFALRWKENKIVGLQSAAAGAERPGNIDQKPCTPGGRQVVRLIIGDIQVVGGYCFLLPLEANARLREDRTAVFCRRAFGKFGHKKMKNGWGLVPDDMSYG